MHPLYQRLKELDPDTFERFCLHLLKARHPGVDIKHVDGRAGDEGVDLFMGELENCPIVWQCKAFPNGVKESQKKQIRESLSRALRTCSPRKWILCTNVDLDSKAFRWCQGLTREYSGRMEIGLMQAGDIVPQLVHYRSVCDEFFPEARLDVAGIRAIAAGLSGVSGSDMRAVAEETLDQLVQRLKERDARFNYEVSFARDVPASQNERPGQVFSYSDGNMVVRGIARDVDALRDAPPQTTMTITKPAAKQIEECIRTGRAQKIPAGQIAGIKTDLPFLELLGSNPRDFTLDLSASHKETVPLRMTFGSGPSQTTYEYILFKFTRVGTDEVELESTGQQFFTITLVIRERGARIHVTMDFVGAEVRAIRKLMNALKALERSAFIEAFDLSDERRLFRAATEAPESFNAWDRPTENLVRDAASIADTFSVDLRVPEVVTDGDIQGLLMLKAISTGAPAPISSVSLNFVKTADRADLLSATLDRDTVDLEFKQEGFAVRLFDQTINVGSLLVQVRAAPIMNAAETRARWLKAHTGEIVSVTFGPFDNAICRRAT